LNRSAVDQTWQQLVRDRPGVSDLVGAKLIPVAAIDQNPHQPRKGELEGIAELAESIVEYGLLQPIVVEAPAAAGSGRYVLVAGARRLAAYRHLSTTRTGDGSRWSAIPAIERDAGADDRLVLAVLENVARQDLSEAEVMTALRVLRELRQWSSSEIARRLGVTRQWVNMFFRVADDAELSEHVQAGRLSVAKAQDVRTARTPAARAAALAAALEGASLRRIREIARGGVADDASANAESDFPDGAADDVSAPPGALRGTDVTDGARAPAGRDIAELADERGVRARLEDFQVASLILELTQARTDELKLGDFIRRMREDLRTARARVLAATPAPGISRETR
jgi:ParB/RepB/Spo0J family partition protein